MAKLPPKLPLFTWKASIPCGLTLLLAACAGTGTSALSGNLAPPKAAIIPGVVAAIRPAGGQTPLAPSSADVLAALQLPVPKLEPNATEFVIQRNDGNAASIVLATPASNPDASMSAADFSVGDHVELITGVRTELIHLTP